MTGTCSFRATSNNSGSNRNERIEKPGRPSASKRKKPIRFLAVVPLVVVLLWAFTIAPAQTLEDASGPKAGRYVTGVVLDTSNATVSGATVVVAGGQSIQTITTTEDGTFRIVLPAGIYSMEAKQRGFCRARRARFRVSSSSITRLDFRLIVCPVVHSLTLEGDRYRGENASERPPFKEEEFSINSSGFPLNLLIQYGERVNGPDGNQYSGFTLSDGKRFGGMATYDLLTIYADRMLFEPKSLRLQAQGTVVFARGGETVKCATGGH